jgi:hypothetical protein
MKSSKFSKFDYRGASGNFRERIPTDELFNRSTDFYKQRTDRIRLTSEKKCNNEKCSKFHAWGATWDFFWKKYSNNNFSTNEPISTNTLPIDSTRQAITHINLKIFQNSF